MNDLKCMVLCLVLFLLLMIPTAFAEETAEDITSSCTYHALSTDKLFRLTDGKLKSPYEGRAYTQNWIEIQAPQDRPIHGLYMIWDDSASEVTLEVWNSETNEYVFHANVNQGVYLHEFVPLDGVQSVRFSSTDHQGQIPLTEINVLAQGKLPEWVQVWEPPCTDADLLVLVAHPDDELLFFGGTLPWYAIEKHLHVAVAYMTCRNTTRYHEMLNGLWTCGIHEYPYLIGLIDKTATVKMSTTYKQWGGIDPSLDAVAGMLELANPSVVCTQDLGGEYGHGAHMAVADICLRIIRDNERVLTNKPQKLYLHLYEENPVQLNWEIPMTERDGQTSLEIAAEAFQCHESQLGLSAKMKNGKKYRFEIVAGGPLDNGKFGLAYSSVGPDETGSDFMEHIEIKTH
jgi:LmbE family N-acetylglucosaminyl deacetylase